MNREESQATFYFHDYETFGIDPALDRPSQFGGVRTDMDFNLVEEPFVVYCKPSDDYLPQPEAVMVTGITPQEALKKGVVEAEFAKQIHQKFSTPNTCIVGYNNIRFDDEVTRNIFYRNFYDPYAYSWQSNNSRWDLIDVVRACYALRPEGINWPMNDDGTPSFRLELLTKANGISHENAHDAMSDVYATIEIAKLIKTAQPRLFDFLLKNRHKRVIANMIDVSEMTPLVHVSGMFGALRSNLSLVAPLAWHPENQNAVIMCDLAGDMTPLLTLSADELRTRLYTPRHELLEDEAPVPLKLVHSNKCPVLAPLQTLRESDATRIGLDRKHCLDNLELLKQHHSTIREKVMALYSVNREYAEKNDVDTQIYSGFFTPADKAAMNIILKTKPENIPALDLSFNDPRMADLLFRFRARNYPHTLDDAEQKKWLLHRQEKLSQQNLQDYMLKLDALYQEHSHDDAKVALLQALGHYLQELVN